MFESLIECSRNKQRGKKWKYFAVTSIVWVMGLTASIAAGIFLYDAQLNAQLSILTMIASLPPLPPAPLGSSNNPAVASNKSSGGKAVQTAIMPVREAPPLPADLPLVKLPLGGGAGVDFGANYGSPDGISGAALYGSPDGVWSGAGTSAGSAPPPPPQPPDPPVEKQKASLTKISEGVTRGIALVKKKPEYPMTARAAHVEGDVQVEITIGEDGAVIKARVVSGHPLLRLAAQEAAKQWKFNPTLLNKNPVKVQGILTFRFTL